jgi:hypothetical protein
MDTPPVRNHFAYRCLPRAEVNGGLSSYAIESREQRRGVNSHRRRPCVELAVGAAVAQAFDRQSETNDLKQTATVRVLERNGRASPIFPPSVVDLDDKSKGPHPQVGRADVFVTSQGSSYSRFQRALMTGNLQVIETAAAELPAVGLDDALAILAVLAQTKTRRFDRAAARWVGRLLTEARAASRGTPARSAPVIAGSTAGYAAR